MAHLQTQTGSNKTFLKKRKAENSSNSASRVDTPSKNTRLRRDLSGVESHTDLVRLSIPETQQSSPSPSLGPQKSKDDKIRSKRSRTVVMEDSDNSEHDQVNSYDEDEDNGSTRRHAHNRRAHQSDDRDVFRSPSPTAQDRTTQWKSNRDAAISRKGDSPEQVSVSATDMV